MDNKKRVIISVYGGVAELVDKPSDVVVEIRDYDLDNPPLRKDEDGDTYTIIEFS